MYVAVKGGGRKKSTEKKVELSNKSILKCKHSANSNNYVADRIAETSKKGIVVYIGIRVPSREIIKLVEKKNANFDNVNIIDVSGIAPLERNYYVRYVQNPTQLTELSIIVSMLLKKYADMPLLLIFDSLSALRNYVNKEMVVKFVHFLIGKSKVTGSMIELIADKKDEKSDFLMNVAQYCDEVIK